MSSVCLSAFDGRQILREVENEFALDTLGKCLYRNSTVDENSPLLREFSSKSRRPVGGIYFERLLLDDNLLASEEVVRSIFPGHIITLEERIDVFTAVEGLDKCFESFPQCPHDQFSSKLPDDVVIGEISANENYCRAPATRWRAAASNARPSPGPSPAALSSRRRAGSLQRGSYIFIDADYGRNRDRTVRRLRPLSRASLCGRWLSIQGRR